MLYQKRIKKKTGDSFSDHPLAVITFVMVLMIAIYMFVDFRSQFWVLKFSDVIAAIAQIATAGAFYIGFKQYRDSKLKDRQLVLFNECEKLCQRLTEIIIKIPSTDPNISDYGREFTKITNIAGDIRLIFNEMSEDVLKAIARMHWQSMYLNSLIPITKALPYEKFLLNSGVDIKTINLIYAIHFSNAQNGPLSNVAHLYAAAHTTCQIENVKNINLADCIWLDFVHEEFFNQNNIDDLMYGTINRVSMFYGAPLLAGLYETRKKLMLTQK